MGSLIGIGFMLGVGVGVGRRFDWWSGWHECRGLRWIQRRWLIDSESGC